MQGLARCGEGAGRPSAELKAAQVRGSLLDAEAVEREWSDVLGALECWPCRAGQAQSLSRCAR
jgi:hypothetical protein